MKEHKTRLFEFLKEEYPQTNYTIDEIADKFGYNRNSIKVYAHSLGLKRPRSTRRCLTEEEEKFLRENYEYGDLKELSTKLGRTRKNVGSLARARGLVRNGHKGRRNGSLAPLLDESLVSFYWLGFMAADGYISKDGHLMFSQSEKGKESVYKFAKYVNSSVYVFECISKYTGKPHTTYRVNIQDAVLGKRIRKTLWKMGAKEKKTYTGIDLEFIKDDDQLMSFFMGFFDGDGSANVWGGGRIEVHESWKNLLDKFHTDFDFKNNPPIINKRGYCSMGVPKLFMDSCSEFAVQNTLPTMSRKWKSLPTG